MAEVKFADSTYTVRGGSRQTNYQDFQSCVKRMKNLHRKGNDIVRIDRFKDGSYFIYMGGYYGRSRKQEFLGY